MDILITILVIAILILFGFAIMIYNNLISLKNHVAKNWSNIAIILKQRNSELPKLIEICNQYMVYEKDTLERLVHARSEAVLATEKQDLNSLGISESQIRFGLGKLFALAENYPDLKADASFANLRTRINTLESSISDRRELYNESVNLNNIRIEQFPDLIIANLFRFKHFDLLHFSDQETQDVPVGDLFSKK